jgi:hypothetical protein
MFIVKSISSPLSSARSGMKTRLLSMPLLTELGLILLAQVYKQVAPNGAFNPPLC